MSRPKTFAVAAIVGVAILGATPAFATDLDASRSGVQAWSHGANGQIAVKDTKGDSREVYANYNRLYANGNELRNSGGYGSTVFSIDDQSDPIYSLQACVAINYWPDDCTSWVN